MNILIINPETTSLKVLYRVTPELQDKVNSVNKKITVQIATALDSDIDTKLAWAEVLLSPDLKLLTEKNVTKIKWLHLTSAGANKLPDYILKSDILITNSSGVHPIPISEHVFGLMLMLTRKLHKSYRTQIKQKKWSRSYEEYEPQELFGRTIIIVGMGRIGERIAKIADCFGMNIYGIVRNPNKKRNGHAKLFDMSDLPLLLNEGDFVVNCLPGTDQTKGIFNLKLFKRFKPSSFFINIGRGTSVVEQDLIKALETGTIAGAGLDVFEVEPLPQSSPLWNLENVIITPHYSGWTPKYTERAIDIFIENLKAYLAKTKMPNEVDKKLGY